MFRLRTTVSLSVLALAIGIAGTLWLSALTSDWQGPTGKPSARRDAVRTVLRRHARTATPAQPKAVATEAPTNKPQAQELLALTPIDMPSLPPSWLQRTAFVDGRVVLTLGIDGQGYVDQAAVSESSGNAALDQRALRTVARWRFAVPSDQPNGLTGSVVMRFDNTSPNAAL